MLGYDFRNGAQLSYPVSHQPYVYVYTLAYRLRNQRRGLGLTKGNGYTPDKKGKVIKNMRTSRNQHRGHLDSDTVW